TVVPDRPGGELHAVADDVVLPGENIERLHRVERVEPPLRHRERIVREVDLLVVLVPLVHWEVDDPAEFEHIGLGEAELSSDTRPRLARELRRRRFLARGEKQGVASLDARLAGDGPKRL